MQRYELKLEQLGAATTVTTEELEGYPRQGATEETPVTIFLLYRVAHRADRAFGSIS